MNPEYSFPGLNFLFHGIPHHCWPCRLCCHFILWTVQIYMMSMHQASSIGLSSMSMQNPKTFSNFMDKSFICHPSPINQHVTSVFSISCKLYCPACKNHKKTEEDMHNFFMMHQSEHPSSKMFQGLLAQSCKEKKNQNFAIMENRLFNSIS